MPSSVVWDGLSGANYFFGSFSSSWSEKGEPLAHLPYKGPSDGNVLMPVFENGLKELGKYPAAVMPVERYTGKLMLVCGEAEKLWPSCPMTDQLVARARKAGAPSPIFLRYKDAGHGVMGAPFTATAAARQLSKLGGTVAGNAAARADSWPKIVAFLRAELDPKPPSAAKQLPLAAATPEPVPEPVVVNSVSFADIKGMGVIQPSSRIILLGMFRL